MPTPERRRGPWFVMPLGACACACACAFSFDGKAGGGCPGRKRSLGLMMSQDGLDPAKLLRAVDDRRSVPDLQRYFGVGVPPDAAPPFTGGSFDRLGGGGDHPAVRNVITSDDLIAVQMLSVRVPARAALDLLDGDLGKAVTAQLRDIPTEIDLGDDKNTTEAAELVKDGGPADTAWRLLKACRGVGGVIAGKVLARKRPQLIPLYDNVVRCAFGAPEHFWQWLDGRLRSEVGVLRHRLTELHAEAGLPKEVSALRTLDVVVWMRHHDAHTGHRCAGLGL